MNLTKYLAPFVVAVLSSSQALAELKLDAPFDLNWGDTLSEAIAQDLPLSCDEKDNSITVCTQADLPTDEPHYWYAFLYFIEGKGLQKAGYSFINKDDFVGEKQRLSYFSRKERYTAELGEPLRSREIFKEYINEQPWRFFPCISYGECGKWFSVWETENGDLITLSLTSVVGETFGKLTETITKPEFNEEN